MPGLSRTTPLAVFKDRGVVPECYQGEKEFEDDRRVDMVHPFPYRVGDPIGARGRGGGALGEGESDFSLGERGGGRVTCKATPARQGVFGG